MPKMEVDIELGILDPEWAIEIEGHFDESASIGSEQVEPVFDRGAQGVVETTFAKSGAIKEEERADVTKLAARLHDEEAVV